MWRTVRFACECCRRIICRHVFARRDFRRVNVFGWQLVFGALPVIFHKGVAVQAAAPNTIRVSSATAKRPFNKWLAVSSSFSSNTVKTTVIVIHIHTIIVIASCFNWNLCPINDTCAIGYTYRYRRRRSGRNRDEHPSVRGEKCTRLHYCSECRQTGNESVVKGRIEVVRGASIWLWLKTVQHPDRVIR